MSHKVSPELEKEYVQAKRNELEAILVRRHADLAAGEEPAPIPRKHFDSEDQSCTSLIVVDSARRRRELNALRHGLTGQTVLMPWEDRQEYEAFCSEFLADLAPVGFEQRQLAQTVADCQWRLNRASAYENAVLTYRAYLADQDLHDNSLVEGEMAKARAFPITQTDILNISLYESRIQRKMMNARKALKELQSEPRPISEPRPEGAVAPALSATREPQAENRPNPRPRLAEAPLDFVFSDLETVCAPPPPAKLSPAQIDSGTIHPAADFPAELENLSK